MAFRAGSACVAAAQRAGLYTAAPPREQTWMPRPFDLSQFGVVETGADALGRETPLSDIAAIRALLLDAARRGEAVSYSDMLASLGHRFTRPKMRALCRALDAIDRAGALAGEPGLAVLVVRESDRLPGQGWWVGRRDHGGAWTGPAAEAFVGELQARVFDYWRTPKPG